MVSFQPWLSGERISQQGICRLSKSSFLPIRSQYNCVAFSNTQLALTGYNRVSDYYGFEIALPQVVSVPSFSLADIGEMVSFKEI